MYSIVLIGKSPCRVVKRFDRSSANSNLTTGRSDQEKAEVRGGRGSRRRRAHGQITRGWKASLLVALWISWAVILAPLKPCTPHGS